MSETIQKPTNNINDRIDRRKAFKPNKRVLYHFEKEICLEVEQVKLRPLS